MALSLDAHSGIISPSTVQTDNDLDMLSKRFEQLNQLEEEKNKFMTVGLEEKYFCNQPDLLVGAPRTL